MAGWNNKLFERLFLGILFILQFLILRYMIIFLDIFHPKPYLNDLSSYLGTYLKRKFKILEVEQNTLNPHRKSL